MIIGVITTSRADFGIYLPLLKRIKQDPELSLNIYALGMHLSTKFGNTIKDIEKEGFNIIQCDPSISEQETNATEISYSMGKTLISMCKAFSQNPSDAVLCLGDRFEMHAAVSSLIPFDIPLIHIHGGEVSEGAIDEKFRHSISKLADYHLTSTESHSKRLIQMGCHSERVHCIGSLSIENLRNTKLLSITELNEKFKVDFSKPTILGTYHPITNEVDKLNYYADEFIKALEQSPYQFVLTLGSADTGESIMRDKLTEFARSNERIKVINHMGSDGYFSAMKYCKLIIGNSSSGIIEAASFNKPAVNIGNRQKGRACSKNIIHCSEDADSITNAIEKSLTLCDEKFQNIYEKENSSLLAYQFLKSQNLTTSYKFHDLNN